MKNKLIIFSGSSGVGKKTILSKLLADKNLKLKYSISLTTRAPRDNEKNGIDYFFVSDKEFDQAIANDKLLEWAIFVDNKYGTPKSFIDETLKKGYSPILEIEVQGALKVMQNYNKEYISIFILPPSIDELKKRLLKRNTENMELIEKRINEAIKEIQFKDRYQYIVINDDINQCVKEIKKILKNA